LSAFGALAFFVDAFFTVFVVLGAGLTAIVLAVACDGMLAKLA
jgi:hypothetical protein